MNPDSKGTKNSSGQPGQPDQTITGDIDMPRLLQRSSSSESITGSVKRHRSSSQDSSKTIKRRRNRIESSSSDGELSEADTGKVMSTEDKLNKQRNEISSAVLLEESVSHHNNVAPISTKDHPNVPLPTTSSVSSSAAVGVNSQRKKVKIGPKRPLSRGRAACKTVATKQLTKPKKLSEPNKKAVRTKTLAQSNKRDSITIDSVAQVFDIVVKNAANKKKVISSETNGCPSINVDTPNISSSKQPMFIEKETDKAAHLNGYPFDFVLTVWMVRDNKSKKLAPQVAKDHQVLNEYLQNGIDIGIGLENLVIFLNREPENKVGYQTIMILLSDFIRRVSLEDAYEFCSEDFLKRIRLQYRFILIHVVAIRAYKKFKSGSFKTFDELKAPFHVTDLLKKEEGDCIVCERPSATIYDKLKSEIVSHVQLHFGEDPSGTESLMCFSVNRKSKEYFIQIMINAVLKNLNSETFDLFMEAARLDSYHSGTTFLIISYVNSGCVSVKIHPEILTTKFNTIPSTEQSLRRRPVKVSIEDVENFNKLLYSSPGMIINPNNVTFSLFQMAYNVGIPDIFKFLFGENFNIWNCPLSCRAVVLKVLVSMKDKYNLELQEIIESFETWLPVYDQSKFIKNLSAEEVILVFGNKKLKIQELDKFLMIRSWVEYRLEKAKQDSDMKTLQLEGKGLFKQVSQVINFAKLVDHKRFVITTRLTDASSFNPI